MTLRGDPTGGILFSFILPAGAVLMGLAAALGIGLLAGIISRDECNAPARG